MLVTFNCNNVYCSNINQLFYLLDNENENDIKKHLQCFSDNNLHIICLLDLKKFHKKNTLYVLSKYQKNNNNFKIAVSYDIENLIEKSINRKNYFHFITINYIYKKENDKLYILDNNISFNIIDFKNGIEYLLNNKFVKNKCFLVKGSDFDEKILIALNNYVNFSNISYDSSYEKIIITSNILKLFNKIGLFISYLFTFFLIFFIPIIYILKIWSYKRLRKK